MGNHHPIRRARDGFAFGKAISGGTPITEDQIRALTRDQLVVLRERLAPRPLEKTDDELSLRLAEEIDYSRRILEHVEGELGRRQKDPRAVDRAMQQIDEAESILDDVADIVEAKNRCEAVQNSKSAPVKRRLLRKPFDGRPDVCPGIEPTA